MSEKTPETWSAQAIIGWMALVACFAILFLVAWWHLHVTQWGPRYANAGSFGDAFAPATGVLTAFALGAAIIAVFMQSAELREARKQYTEQAAALREANELARRANHLAFGAQAVEIARQISELDQHGVEAFDAIQRTGVAIEPAKVWYDYVRCPSNDRAGIHAQYDTAQLQELVSRREALGAALQGLTMVQSEYELESTKHNSSRGDGLRLHPRKV